MTTIMSPSESAIRAQLERILQSEDFRTAAALHKFLRFVVEEALAGRGDQLNAKDEASAALTRMHAVLPQTEVSLAELMRRTLLSKEHVELVLNGLRKAGMC